MYNRGTKFSSEWFNEYSLHQTTLHHSQTYELFLYTNLVQNDIFPYFLFRRWITVSLLFPTDRSLCTIPSTTISWLLPVIISFSLPITVLSISCPDATHRRSQISSWYNWLVWTTDRTCSIDKCLMTCLINWLTSPQIKNKALNNKYQYRCKKKEENIVTIYNVLSMNILESNVQMGRATVAYFRCWLNYTPTRKTISLN